MIGGGMSHKGMFRRKQGSSPVAPFFTFKTKFNGEVSFEITKSGTPATWYMGDGTIYTNTNSVTHTYADGSEKEVFVSVDDLANVTGLGTFANKSITYADISALENITGLIYFYSNPLTEILLPNNSTASGNVTGLNVSDTLITELDWSGLVNFQGVFRCSNTLVTSISNPPYITGNLGGYNADNNPEILGLDLSTLNRFAVACQLFVHTNPKMTSLLLPKKTDILTVLSFLRIYAYNCNLTGTLTVEDCMNGNGGPNHTLDIRNNSNLTKVEVKVTNTLTNFNIDCRNCDITGSIDLSSVKKCGGVVVSDNSSLTGIILNPSNSAPLDLSALNCDITGILDISDQARLNTLKIYNNINLTGILFGSSLTNVLEIEISSCNLTGTVDLTPLESQGTSTRMDFSNNPLLTDVLFYSAPRSMSSGEGMRLNDCALGVLMWTNFSGGLFPNQGHPIATSIYLENNGMSAAEVNENLDLLDSMSTSVYAPNRRIFIDGTNAAPDSSSGGYDGDAAKASLISKGYTVTTN